VRGKTYTSDLVAVADALCLHFFLVATVLEGLESNFLHARENTGDYLECICRESAVVTRNWSHRHRHWSNCHWLIPGVIVLIGNWFGGRHLVLYRNVFWNKPFAFRLNLGHERALLMPEWIWGFSFLAAENFKLKLQDLTIMFDQNVLL
jgi:hypothetical protein